MELFRKGDERGECERLSSACGFKTVKVIKSHYYY